MSVETLELPVRLEDILQVEQVNVVEKVNTKNLRILLEWVVDQLQRRVAKADLDELREELSGAGRESNEKLKQLEKKQGEIVKELELQEEALKDVQNGKEEVQDLSSHLGELGTRVEALERGAEDVTSNAKAEQENVEQVKNDVKALQDEVKGVKENVEIAATRLDEYIQENEGRMEEESAKCQEEEVDGVEEDRKASESPEGGSQEGNGTDEVGIRHRRSGSHGMSSGEEQPIRRRSSTSSVRATIRESLEGLENRICAIEEALPSRSYETSASAHPQDAQAADYRRNIVPQSSINKKELQALEEKVNYLASRLDGACSGQKGAGGDGEPSHATKATTESKESGAQGCGESSPDGGSDKVESRKSTSESPQNEGFARSIKECNDKINTLWGLFKSLNDRVSKQVDTGSVEKGGSDIARSPGKIDSDFQNTSSPPSHASAISALGRISSFGRSDTLDLDIPSVVGSPLTGDQSQDIFIGVEGVEEDDDKGSGKIGVGDLASAVQSLMQKKADVTAVDHIKLHLDKLMGEVKKLSKVVDANGGATKGALDQSGATTHSSTPLDCGSIRQQLEDLRDVVELVGSAAGILAVGPAESDAEFINIPSTNFSSAGGGEHMGVASDENCAEPLKKRAKAAIDRLYGGNDRGALRRLENLMERGDVRHKMDSFDPDALNKLAFKLASLENSMRQQFAVTPNGVPKEVEKQLRRLAASLRQMKSKMQDAPQSPKMPFGDYAMLSTKPIMGYKCMACDRPLEKLDQYAGPYLPNDKLPGLGRTSPELRSEAGSPRQNSPSTPDGKRGPQHWYDEVHGPAAQHLPREDVGPHLPPGGWRGHERLAGVLRGRVSTSRESLPRINTPVSR